MRQPQALAEFDLPDHVVGAKAGVGQVGIEERINGRQAVFQLVDDADHAQGVAVAKLDQMGADVALEQEMAVLLAAVLIHAAAGVTRHLVAAIQAVMLRIKLQPHQRRRKISVAFLSAVLGAISGVFIGQNPHRYAGLAMVAIGSIGEGARTAKTQADQLAVGRRVDQITRCSDLGACEFPGQVAARVGRGGVKLKLCRRDVIHEGHRRTSMDFS